MLTPGCLAVLERYKVRLLTRKREDEGITAISVEEIKEVAAAREQLDAKSYATWAGKQLAEMVNGNHEDPVRVLREADVWYLRMLRCGYLVKKDYLRHAYEKAIEFAGRKHGEESR